MKFTSGDIGAIADELRAGFEENVLHVPSIETVPVENAIEAYEKIASGQAGAKLVLTFS